MSQKKEFLIRKVQSGLAASRKLFGITSFPVLRVAFPRGFAHSLAHERPMRTRIRTVGRKKKFRDVASVDNGGRKWTE